MPEQELCSPELALVDPELRARAIEDLNADFLPGTFQSLSTEPRPIHRPEQPPPAGDHRVGLQSPSPSRAHAWTLVVATCTYAAFSVAQVAFWAFVVLAALTVSISLTYLL